MISMIEANELFNQQLNTAKVLCGSLWHAAHSKVLCDPLWHACIHQGMNIFMI